MSTRTTIQVQGLVQGVGFRPFVWRLARELGLRGSVSNSPGGVEIVIERDDANGVEDAQRERVFLERLRREAPPAATIHSIGVSETSVADDDAATHSTFSILHSTLGVGGAAADAEITQVAPDIAVCPDCLRDRETQPHRLAYPFINCTNCGPRFSIIKDLPYDRPRTTMAAFEMCPDCRREYEDPRDRRFHAQPIACNHCGPGYYAFHAHYAGEKITDYARLLALTASLLDAGGIVAVKGIGGYHLACDATNAAAVRRLREIKRRDTKPFAVLFPDAPAAARYVEISDAERAALESWRRPIVLLRQRATPAPVFHPGGMTDFSRWLSEAWRATPPENMTKKIPHPEGVPDVKNPRIWHPSGMRCFFMTLLRWCRSPILAQPPAGDLASLRDDKPARSQDTRKTEAAAPARFSHTCAQGTKLEQARRHALPPDINPGMTTLGCLLPYMPLHHDLFRHLATPALVFTSGNITDTPIAIDEPTATAQFATVVARAASPCDDAPASPCLRGTGCQPVSEEHGQAAHATAHIAATATSSFSPSALQPFSPFPSAALLLHHNREIHNRVDDSVVQIINTPNGGKPTLLRRSRGYAPEPFFADIPTEGILAFGAEKTASFALGRDHSILMSQHLGDLQNAETLAFYEESLTRYQRLFRFTPRRLVCDLHPDYLSTRAAEQTAADLRLPLLRVQHHHAHAAACMLEHRLHAPLIAAVWDATGLGPDGTIWGGEFLHCDRKHYTRLAHLENVPMPGGDQTALEPWRMAVSWLRHYNLSLPENFATRIAARAGLRKLAALTALLEANINCPLTSSAGRLFDALASLLALCDIATRQAEAPTLLEHHALGQKGSGFAYCGQQADRNKQSLTPFPAAISLRPLFEGVLADLRAAVPTPHIAAKIHESLAQLIVEKIAQLQRATGAREALITGGCFQNKLLTERVLALCAERDITLHIPEQLPCNDSAIAAGHLAIAAAMEIPAAPYSGFTSVSLLPASGSPLPALSASVSAFSKRNTSSTEPPLITARERSP